MLNKKGQLTDIGKAYLGKENSGAAQVAKFVGWAAIVVGAMFWMAV
jgi:hypothetical protein